MDENKKIYDISPLVSEQLAVFPGDQPYKRNIALSFDKGHHFALSSIEASLHIGAHTDAPNHYDPEGVGINNRDLSIYLGDCQVVKVEKNKAERIYPEDLKVEINSKRVLFNTNSFNDVENWTDDFNSLSKELVEFLHEKKVILVGIDTPSVDPATCKELSAHKTIAKNNMAILEGIVLKDIEEKNYNLIALPLKLKDADASPVRAILMEK